MNLTDKTKTYFNTVYQALALYVSLCEENQLKGLKELKLSALNLAKNRLLQIIDEINSEEKKTNENRDSKRMG